MNLPFKYKKPNTPVSIVPVDKTRKEFVEDLPVKMRNTVRGIDLVLIIEAITAITEGHATINGKAPNTRSERYIVIATFFRTVQTPLNMFFDGSLMAGGNYTVEFTCRNKPYTITHLKNLSENQPGEVLC